MSATHDGRQAALGLRQVRVLEPLDELRHGRAVTQEAGQRVAPRGLEEVACLAVEADLGGIEDVPEQAGQDHGGQQDDAQSARLRLADGRQERLAVAVDLEDGLDRAVRGDDRQVLLDDHLGDAATRLRVRLVLGLGLDVRGRQSRGEGLLELLAAFHLTAQGRVVAVQDGAVGRVDLEAQDVGVRFDQPQEGLLDRGDARFGAAAEGHVGGRQAALCEALGERAIGAGSRGDGRRLDVLTDDGGQAEAGQPDEREADPEDEQQEARPPMGPKGADLPVLLAGPAGSGRRLGGSAMSRPRTLP